MARFEGAIDTVLKHEGGYVNHPSDPGGATNFGISLRWLNRVGISVDIDCDGDTDKEDMKSLPKKKAVELYREHWRHPLYDQLESQDVATKVFDTAVNVRCPRAHRFLQKALNSRGQRLVVDGVLGPKTVTAANGIAPAVLLSAYRTEQLSYYQIIAAQKPQLAKFLRGWTRRAMS